MVALVLVLLALFAFSGSSFAAEALPFAVGATVGYCLAYLAITTGYSNWVHAAAGFLAALVITALGLTLASSFADFGWPGWALPLFDTNEGSGRFAYGFSVAFFIAILRRLVFRRSFPDTPEEARKRRREVARGTLIVGRLFLILTVLALAVSVVLALLAYVVGTFAG